jgi:uncharacterized protein with GYD domain
VFGSWQTAQIVAVQRFRARRGRTPFYALPLYNFSCNQKIKRTFIGSITGLSIGWIKKHFPQTCLTDFAETANRWENIAMHFCLTGQYTPQALKNIMENPTTNRYEAAKKLTEAAGGKLISMYSTATDGPGVLVIIDVPDPSAAPAMTGVVVESGALHNVKLTRLWTQDEIKQVRQKASELRGAYKPPGK